jgi:hypothetical protein
MTWSGSSGTGIPQPCARWRDREMLKSASPASMNESTSLRRAGGSMRSRPLPISSRNSPAYRDRRKNQFSSLTGCGGVSCSGQRPSRSSSGG